MPLVRARQKSGRLSKLAFAIQAVRRSVFVCVYHHGFDVASAVFKHSFGKGGHVERASVARTTVSIGRKAFFDQMYSCW